MNTDDNYTPSEPIRVDKCSTFGIKKELTKSIQYLPKQFVNNCLVPCVDTGKSFRYLGGYFARIKGSKTHTHTLYWNYCSLTL